MNAYAAAWFSFPSKGWYQPPSELEYEARGRPCSRLKGWAGFVGFFVLFFVLLGGRLVLTDQVLLLYPSELARCFQAYSKHMCSTASLPATAKIGQSLQIQLP